MSISLSQEQIQKICQDKYKHIVDEYNFPPKLLMDDLMSNGFSAESAKKFTFVIIKQQAIREFLLFVIAENNKQIEADLKAKGI